METDARLELIKQVGEEIVTEDELKELLSKKKQFIAYDGFEPSGNLHIAQGIMRAINVNKMIKAGCKFKMLVADWHAWANNKYDGDLDKIEAAGKYIIEVWKSCGMDLEHVEFVRSNDAVNDPEYWKLVMRIARESTLKRVVRCSQIMGRKESDSLSASQILYPCMQCADIFYLNSEVTQLGMDQRKVNMLAREIGEKLGYWKPVVVSHHMLMGLKQPASGTTDAIERAIEMKMSKSIPDSAIFMTDSEADINSKIQKAYCPIKQVGENPMMEYSKYIIFEKFSEMKISREEKFGGDLVIKSYQELSEQYAAGKIHPADLKKAVAYYLNQLIEPVRQHFERNASAKKLLEQVSSFAISR